MVSNTACYRHDSPLESFKGTYNAGLIDFTGNSDGVLQRSTMSIDDRRFTWDRKLTPVDYA